MWGASSGAECCAHGVGGNYVRHLVGCGVFDSGRVDTGACYQNEGLWNPFILSLERVLVNSQTSLMMIRSLRDKEDAMSDYAMNSDDLFEASVALYELRYDMSQLELNECLAPIDTGSEAVRDALNTFADHYAERTRVTTNWLSRTAFALAFTARSTEESDESIADVLRDIRAKL